MPSFYYNLIPLSELLTHMQSYGVFILSACILLHGLFLKKSLVLGKIQKGLYLLQSDNLSSIDSCTSSFVNTTTTMLKDVNKSSFNSCNFVPSITVNSIFSSSLSFDHIWHLRLSHVPFAKMKSYPFFFINCLRNKFSCALFVLWLGNKDYFSLRVPYILLLFFNWFM